MQISMVFSPVSTGNGQENLAQNASFLIYNRHKSEREKEPPGADGMSGLRSLFRTAALFAMVFVVAALHAQDGLSDAVAHLSPFCDSLTALVGSSIATADFNHDTYPDGAVLFRSNNTFHIEVHFRFRHVSEITFDSTVPSLALSAIDVNHDGNPDLVVEEPFSRQRLFVWLNDGRGRFHRAHVDDFPSGSDDTDLRLSLRSESPDGRALAVPGKSRIRTVPSGLYGIPVAFNLAEPAPKEIAPSSHFSSAPSLLRGPPLSVHL
jgi:hypothetical protein